MSVLYLRSALSDISLGTNNTNKLGTAVAWRARAMTTTAGTGANVTATVASVTGPTAGLETGAPTNEWISPPMAAAATISNTITFNICAQESNAMANATVAVIVQRLSNTGSIVSTVVDSSFVTELGTTNGRRTWTALPTSTSFAKGDRIRIRIYFDDNATTTNMVSGYTLTLTYDGTNANTGDSNVDFTEGLSFMSTSSASQVLLLASDAAADDSMGFSVAMSASGDRVVSGARNEDGSGGGSVDKGAVYVNSGTNYGTQLKLVAADGLNNDWFGYSVDMTDDGSIIVVGAVQPVAPGTGAVYVLSGANYATQKKLLASDGASGDNFGVSVACSSTGSVVVVGSPFADVGATLNQGAVYVYSGANLATQTKLTAFDGARQDQFGTSVACSSDGSVVVVGAMVGAFSGDARGAVYVYSGTNYSTVRKLTPSNTSTGEQFGSAVACSDDGSVIVVGAYGKNTFRGSAYVYSGANYATETILTASDGTSNDSFGRSVACSADGSVVIVGAYVADISGGATSVGAVYTYSGLNYQSERKITAATVQGSSYFAYDVACSSNGRLVAAGAYQYTGGAGSFQGATYVSETTAGQILYLTNTTSDITPITSLEKVAWTSRGTG